MQKNTLNDEINIFPNPCTIYTTLHSNKPFNDATITLYNSFGQRVRQITKVHGQLFKLQREKLPNGLYILRMEEKNEIVTSKKLIIED